MRIESVKALPKRKRPTKKMTDRLKLFQDFIDSGDRYCKITDIDISDKYHLSLLAASMRHSVKYYGYAIKVHALNDEIFLERIF